MNSQRISVQFQQKRPNGVDIQCDILSNMEYGTATMPVKTVLGSDENLVSELKWKLTDQWSQYPSLLETWTCFSLLQLKRMLVRIRQTERTSKTLTEY